MAKKYQAQMLLHRYVMDNLEPTYLLSGASNIELEQNIKLIILNLKGGIKVLNSFKTDSQKYWKERNELSWN
jgi:hypothetical protein